MATPHKRGARFEEFASELAWPLCHAMSIPVSDNFDLQTRRTMKGDPYKFEIDITIEDESVLVLIECKDWHHLSRETSIYSYHGLMRVAKAHPDKTVYPIMLSTSPTPAVLAAEIDSGIVQVPDNIDGKARVIVVPSVRVNRWIVAYEPLAAAGCMYALRLTPSVAGSDLAELIETGLRSNSFRGRLDAAALILSHPGRTPESEGRALRELSDALVHGGAYRTVLAANRRLRYVTDAQSDLFAAELTDTMARFGIALNRRQSQCPGLRSVNGLRKILPELDEMNRASANGFLGAWDACFGDVETAAMHLEASHRGALGIGGNHGAYLVFLFHLRSAELLPVEVRSETVPRLLAAAKDLGDAHFEIAESLVARVRRGDDTSIRSTVHEPFD